MRRHARSLLLAAVATAGLAAALATWPSDRSLAVDVYLLVVGALALLVVLRATVGCLPAERASRLDLPAGADVAEEPRLPELRRLERELELAAQPELDAFFRLRPTLYRIAEARFRKRGLEPADLDPRVWELLRPDRPVSRRGRRGPGLAEIEAVVDALERT